MIKTLTIPIITFFLLAICAQNVRAEDFSHIKDLFALRENLSEQGSSLPNAIKKTSGKDLMTLERIFELNTSALTTIEAYFRLFKMALAAGTNMRAEDIKIINEWLEFINNQCKYDIEYLDAAMKETSDGAVHEQIASAKDNIERLSLIAEKGVKENSAILTKNMSPAVE
ncbi:MAG: hypothetical protein PHH49_04615 [Candidatus Omnitrophica bacterium]|nr:hypothetical protein [Candidatus Omnitrophota bacterium]MDD5488230.1 hypothetical protein [Candidatus Omnitrophota bacterium]